GASPSRYPNPGTALPRARKERKELMAVDPYTACPCGSGKKFKWCCQPIHEEIARAFDQASEGQVETALRMMDEVIARHPTNPEVHGQKAHLLAQLGRGEDAENALQKALDLNPNYPFGNYQRGRFRHDEGEFPGALLLYRKAIDLYDPSASLILAEIYAAVVDCEMNLNHPVAARAALQLAIRNDPQNLELRQGFDQLFGDKGALPLAARREYTFLGPAADAPGGLHPPLAGNRAAWESALGGATTGKLSDAAAAFEKLTDSNADDGAAWYNLGLTRAWLGDNLRAVEALDRYVALESDEQRAGSAWALAEVLRCGRGMESQTDYQQHLVIFQLRDPERLLHQLGTWEKERRLLNVRVDQEQGLLTGILVQRVTGLTPEHAAQQSPRLAANLMIAGDMVRLQNVNRAALDEVTQELRDKVGPALSEPHHHTGALPFPYVLSDAMVFPVGARDQASAEQRMREGAERYFEDTWIHQPRVALQGVPPVDAAGHGTLRKKLRGVIQFLEECARPMGLPYDFERLLRKLGLVQGAAPAGSAPDIGALGAAELAALALESLSDQQLAEAYQSAVKLDARALAGRFALALLERPPSAERPDHYPWYNSLITQAQAEGNLDAALDYVNQGEKSDCEHNEGRRRNDYELRKAQLHARRGEADQAHDVFERLIQRMPGELRYRASAAESMLSARQGARALKFAEGGLAGARQQNNRDSEQHFLELVAAAKKQGG
ncbi:MAG: tetratricopeptide repeat protein, partial [Gemmataceae bacterium]|nr:tetratricopeptide repeat protein [Gemmataceae bacterium]